MLCYFSSFALFFSTSKHWIKVVTNFLTKKKLKPQKHRAFLRLINQFDSHWKDIYFSTSQFFELSHSSFSIASLRVFWFYFHSKISVYSLRNHDYGFFFRTATQFWVRFKFYFCLQHLTITTIDLILSSFHWNFVVPVRLSLSDQWRFSVCISFFFFFCIPNASQFNVQLLWSICITFISFLTFQTDSWKMLSAAVAAAQGTQASSLEV